MGQSRTIGAVKSFFSKNRRRLDLDRLADNAAAKMEADEMANADLQVLLSSLTQSSVVPLTWSFNVTGDGRLCSPGLATPKAGRFLGWSRSSLSAPACRQAYHVGVVNWAPKGSNAACSEGGIPLKNVSPLCLEMRR